MADISKIKLPDNVEYNIKDGVARDNAVYYGTCSTGASTVAKVATVDGVTEIKTGITIAVKFTNSNTASSPTLNINSLGAKAIARYGSTAPSTSAASSWNAGAVITMTYDGTRWVMHDWVNTTYSSMTVAEYEAGTSTTSRLITPARLKSAITYWCESIVPSWARASSKPSYTASEVGALPSTTTYVSTVNGNSGAVTVNEAMTPLIGDTDEITPAQVKTALREGRDICITGTGALSGVNLDLRFTSWNGATDTPYSGQAVDIVASQTIAYYGTEYYLFELVGTVTLASWELFSTTLASGVTSADISAWNGAVTTANTALSGVNGTLIYDHTYTISNGVATFTPHVYLKGQEVTTNYAVSCFTWKYKLADNVTGTPSYVNLTTNNDRTCTVTISALGYGGYVLGEFTPA